MNIRAPHSGKVLRLKTISLGFWVCQEARGSGDEAYGTDIRCVWSLVRKRNPAVYF